MHRSNNFDFLRLLFASFVIVSHSYTLTGSNDCDWICRFSKGQVIFAYIGVKGFFVLSGYLIFQSMERSKGFFDYFTKRFLRLFPALLAVLLLTLFVLVPLVYKGIVPFYKQSLYWSYLRNNLLLYPIQYNIPGVFEQNPFPNVINGSLWTIAYEFTMYVFIALFLFVKRFSPYFKWVLLVFVILLGLSNIAMPRLWASLFTLTYLDAELLVDLATFFLIGSLLAAFKIEMIAYKYILTILFLLLIALALYYNVFMPFRYVLLPLPILLFGLSSTPIIQSIGKYIGDLSYGIYIYGFVVQQLLVYYWFPVSPLALTCWSLLLTCVISYASWHLVEKPALKMKKHFG